MLVLITQVLKPDCFTSRNNDVRIAFIAFHTEVCPHFTHPCYSNNCIRDSIISPQQSAPVRREEVLTHAPSELLAQLGLGEAGVPGEEEVDEEILELRETPKLFGAYK